MTVLVVVHLYYQEMWPELKACLTNIRKTSSCRVFVTLVEKSPELEADIRSFDPQAEIVYVKNKGWDVGPFFQVINSVNLDDYDYVVKLHTKRDVMPIPYLINGFDMSGAKWRSFLLKFCSTAENWQKSLDVLRKKDVGMVADARVILAEADDCLTAEQREILSDWEKKLGFGSAQNRKYVSGTMFAVKSCVLKRLQHCFTEDDFAVTVRIKEGAFAHILERLIGYAVMAEGLEIASFDGKKYSPLRFRLQTLRKFFFYHKISQEKEVIKILGISVYRRHF